MMSRGLGCRPRMALAACLIAVGLSASSCDKKSVIVDPVDGLEGVPGAAQLVAWPDTPIPLTTYDDLLPLGPGPEDTVLTVESVYSQGAGTVQGMIFDMTDADRFEVFRRESDGFRHLKDYTLSPTKRFFKGHADIFRFLDYRPGSAPAYIARGLLGGSGGSNAPKTNLAELVATPVAQDLQYTAPTGIPPDFRPMSDSLLVMSWNPVPGAAGYWIQIYQLTNQGGDAIIQSGTPAPIYTGVTRDYLVAYMPAGVTAYTWGDPVPPGGAIFTSNNLINSQFYQVRVAAVNASGQLISFTGSSGTFGIFRGETTYRVFPLGSVLVQPKRRTAPPEPALAGGLPTPIAGLTIYPAGTFPGRSR